MELHWSDVQRIAEELYDADPDLDPLTLSFVKLHDMVVKLPDFCRRSAEGPMSKSWRPFFRLGLTSGIDFV